jgi:hypothetical protein
MSGAAPGAFISAFTASMSLVSDAMRALSISICMSPGDAGGGVGWDVIMH